MILIKVLTGSIGPPKMWTMFNIKLCIEITSIYNVTQIICCFKCGGHNNKIILYPICLERVNKCKRTLSLVGHTRRGGKRSVTTGGGPAWNMLTSNQSKRKGYKIRPYILRKFKISHKVHACIVILRDYSK